MTYLGTNMSGPHPTLRVEHGTYNLTLIVVTAGLMRESTLAHPLDAFHESLHIVKLETSLIQGDDHQPDLVGQRPPRHHQSKHTG